MKNFVVILSVLSLLFLSFGCQSTEEEVYISPTTISGQVKDDKGIVVPNAKISLATAADVSAVFTDALGLFSLTNFPPGKHRLKIEKVGFDIFETEVPKPVNGISTVMPVIQRKTYNLPAIKPMSTGLVRISNKRLETNFIGDGMYHEFVVKGVAFSPMPIGGKPLTKEVYDRSILWLKNLNANTVRTYSGVDKYFLQQAAANNIFVIVSFWVNLDLDLSNPAVRQKVVDDFGTMVFDLKDNPGVLMWNIGNEQNYSSTPNNGNSPYWYSLVQEMAVEAYKAEGEKYHPICISNGSLYNIGNSAMNANDDALTYVDLWGSNAYEVNFTPFFATYRTRSTKPIVITEFGIDAYNNMTKTLQEDAQALYDSTNWAQIRLAKDICVGGTVFEFTDEWWKDDKGNINSHDFGGYPTGMHPDGYANEEWWGIIATTPDSDADGLDDWRIRKAFEMFQRLWK